MRILVAEDEPLEAEGLRRRLEVLGHQVVDVVYDGANAVSQAKALAPDLIFLDVRMPKLDGITAAEAILAHRRVPTVLITGQVEPGVIAKAAKAGVQAHLVKPVDGQELAKAIVLATEGFTELMGAEAKPTAKGATDPFPAVAPAT